MNIKPVKVPIFIVIGVILWLAVTVAMIGVVLQSPAEHVDLAIGLVLIWILLLVFAAASRLTERIGGLH